MNPRSVGHPGFSILSLSADRVLSLSREALPRLTVGDILKAQVLEVGGGRSCIISLKDTVIPARSEAALRAGDSIVVRVERLLPRVILSLLETEEPARPVREDYLRWYRSNPDALRNLFARAAEELHPGPEAALSRHLIPERLQSIHRLMASLFFSKENAGKGFSLREYAENLGLFWESSLGKALSGRRPDAAGKGCLKEMLMKVLGELRSAAEGGAVPEGERAGLWRGIEFLETSVRAIETHQIMNILSREQDGGFLFQIPFDFPGGVRTGDIFIRRDDGGRGSGEDAGCEAIVLLDMDALGRIVVEARMRGEGIRCLIRCESPEVRDFISGYLDDLKEAVRAAGLKIESAACLADAGLEERCEAFYRDRMFHGDAVDLFA